MVSLSIIIATMSGSASVLVTCGLALCEGFAITILSFTPKKIFYPHIICWGSRFFRSLVGGQPQKRGFWGAVDGLGWLSVKGSLRRSFLTPLTCWRGSRRQVRLLDCARAQRLAPVSRACSPQNHLPDKAVDGCFPVFDVAQIGRHKAAQSDCRAPNRIDGTGYDLIWIFGLFCAQEFYRLGDQSLPVRVDPDAWRSSAGYWLHDSTPFGVQKRIIIINIIQKK